MAAIKNSSNLLDKNPINWILGAIAIITLYFQVNLTDPFNSPKSWLLMLFASWLLGYIVNFRKIMNTSKQLKMLAYSLIIFFSSLLISTLATDVRYVAFFGETLRRNGFFSYTSLVLIMLAASICFRSYNVLKLYNLTYFIAATTIIYALIQLTGNDFVDWDNPYNVIIGTVGNPNFAAALMAIMGTLVFASLFFLKTGATKRVFGIAILSLLVFVVYKSNARQGTLTFLIGVLTFLSIWLLTKKKFYGKIFSLSGVILLALSILGMLQIGPLERYLYKSSVSVRGYYWRAGLEMFKDNPIFGVGIDRYGAYFKSYREASYSLNYGFEITSSNAHNLFIQLFATGGIFLGASYLFLNFYIFKITISALKTSSGDVRLYIAGIFSAWIGFHAQSFISIDNIGVSIWGWVLGGALIGLAISVDGISDKEKNIFTQKKNSVNFSRGLISGTATAVSLIVIVPLYQAEVLASRAKVNFDLQDQEALKVFKEFQLDSIRSPFNDPNYVLVSGVNLVRGGFTLEGMEAIRQVHTQDPRNLDALNAMALISEELNQILKAIEYREKIAELDPWNAKNYLALGKNYKKIGNLVKSNKILSLIKSFASSDPIMNQARSELS
jgi:O-antigen ligase